METAEPPTKPLMVLDPEMALTQRVPVHPETGGTWNERYYELCYLATMIRYSGSTPRLEKALEDLTAGVEFRDGPLIKEVTFLGGRAAGVLPGKLFGCHPATWANLSESTRSKFTLVDHGKR